MANTCSIPTLKALMETIHNELNTIKSKEISELESFFRAIPYSLTIDITACSDKSYETSRKIVVSAIINRTMGMLLQSKPALVYTYAQYNLKLLLDRCDALTSRFADGLAIVSAENRDEDIVLEFQTIQVDIDHLNRLFKEAYKSLDLIKEKYVDALESY